MFAKFLRALAQHIRAGCPGVSRDAYAARLAVCNACDARRGSFCTACGPCLLPLKAQLATEPCPRGRWPDIPREMQT